MQALLGMSLLAGLMACSAGFARSNPVALPDPKLDIPATAARGEQTAVFAGGCFWGVEAVFDHVRGVTSAISGYSGGTAMTAQYHVVGTGRTGHAESVKVVFDPTKVSYGQLLKIYFSVAHDPTQLDRQSPDVGPQYRSEIFTTTPAQQKVANAYIAQLTAAKVFSAPIVTRVEPLDGFYRAERYHQNYLSQHPNDPYIVYNDAPKLVHLKAMFPGLYKGG
ncbi:peptide-methionine (S)-S-oxide reductase MsrA [Cognatiluteimonas telluris]|jgi:peptide-methionine (S)-S-oxide reductase|uniref:peptide-methionine (S)-S-oxide reductase MsrA n=1 Tax=Cognatiluteimonas telluris TaxID=1104775 RepID=UPI001407513F|nr:peptide-methionine (S)-S-oxide reductase MsrA [Lysobacter telluris]